MIHHIAHNVPDYITHELAILRLWCRIYRQSPEEFVRRHGARFEERHGQLSKARGKPNGLGGAGLSVIGGSRFDRPSDRP